MNKPQNIPDAVADAVRGLIHNHTDGIREAWAETEDQEQGLSIAVRLKGGFTRPLIDVKLSFARKYSDAVSIQLEDPNQPNLSL